MFKKADLSAGARTLRLLNALTGHPHGRTLADLSSELGVSESTIKRDLAQFAAADIEIERMLIGNRSAVRLTDEKHQSLVEITRRERYTLLATRRMFDVMKGTPLAEDIESLLDKLAPPVTPQEREQIVADRDRFAYVPDGGIKQYRGKEDIINALQSGILKRLVVKYRYRTGRGGAKQGFLAPFSLLLFKHGLYIVGRTLADPDDGSNIPRGNPDILAVERFTSAEFLRGKTFVVPTHFDLDELLVSAFELHVGDPSDSKRVVIEFSKERAAYVRARQWHRSQVLQEQSDGSIILSFTCVNFAPVVSWVLEWGPHALVLEPPELVEIVARDAAETNARYQAHKHRSRTVG